jgi:hypothetical protein
MCQTGTYEGRLNASPRELQARAVREEHTYAGVSCEGRRACDPVISTHLEPERAVATSSRKAYFEVRWLNIILLTKSLRASPNPRVLIRRDLHFGMPNVRIGG